MPIRELLLADADARDLTKREEYEAVGGYASLRKALGMERQAVLDELLAADVRGRGGAGFPMGRKASFLPKPDDTPKPIYLVVNADESEPGTFKDREIMLRVPHLFVEGVITTAYTIERPTPHLHPGEYLTEFEVLRRRSRKRARPLRRQGPPRSASTSPSSPAARGRTSAARKRGCSRRWRGSAGGRATSRRSRRSPAPSGGRR